MAENVQEKAVNANDAMAAKATPGAAAVCHSAATNPNSAQTLQGAVQARHAEAAGQQQHTQEAEHGLQQASIGVCRMVLHHGLPALCNSRCQFLQALTAAHCKGAQQMPSHAQDSAGAWMLTTHSDCLNKGTAELLCKIRLSTSSWHLAYGVAQQKSNMDAPAGHKGYGKVMRHLTCSTCCCCGSSADEVKGYMQGHRGQDNHKCSKVQGLWAILERFNHALSLHKLGDLVVAGVLPNAGAFANLDS